MKYKIILVSGYARAGKDTFAALLDSINPGKFIPYSFAAALKNDLQPLFWKMGIDIFAPTEEQKKLARPVMISYGCAWRELDINHWVKVVDEQIDRDLKILNFTPIITDNRFISETNYFINKYGRENVLVVEIARNGAPQPPKEELENQPKISGICDFRLEWDTEPALIKAKELVREFYNKYLIN